MRRFICASHGEFAKGIVNSLKIIVGEVSNVYAISAYSPQSRDLQRDIDNLLATFNDEDEVIVVTDIFGGSVNNEWMKRMSKDSRIHLISGLNLILLIELVINSTNEKDIDKLIGDAINSSIQGIKYCNRIELETEFEDF